MNRFLLFLFFLMMNSGMYSQNEMIKDSLKIKQIPQNITSKDLIIDQELFAPVNVEMENENLYNGAEMTLPNYLDYKLKLTPDLKPQKLFSTFSYSLNGYRYNFGIGQYYQGGIEFVYKPLDKLTISMGGYVVNYNILHSRYNDVIFNLKANYKFNDWMSLLVFGQYSANSMHNARYGGFMFSPQISYGATLKFKTSEKVDLNIGIERSFNSITKTWETSGMIGPNIRLR